jgi:long-chain acyl-CoA synthetase
MIAQEQLRKGPQSKLNLVQMFEATAARLSTRTATKHKQAGRWIETSWAELARRARDVADGLAAIGLQKGDRVAIIGETTLDWNVADLGALGAGAITVPIYQSLKAHDVQYILENSGARWVFCDGEAQVAKIRQVKDRLPALEGIVRFSGTPGTAYERMLVDVEGAGAEWRAGNEAAHSARVASISVDDPACFIYTSGTTGNPKGVVLTHGNWVYEADAVAQIALLVEDEIVLMFLPMAHSFAKVVQAAWLKLGFTMAFVESIERITDNAGEVKPTVMPAVPRIFEKAYTTVVTKGLATPGVKGKLFKWALESLDAWSSAKERGESPSSSLGLLVGRKLVFPKLGATLAERFGGRIRFFVSGGAPLSPKIAWFFDAVGLTILEGYGLTETSAGTCVNRPGKNKIGTVGLPIPGTEARIAPDGEILIRGGGVMREYYQNPAATAEVIVDGWFHTGDIGSVDADGCVKITDRKKDIIVTAGGKNVAPQNLENELKTEPLVSQVMVHGDKRKFLSALVTLNEENARKFLADRNVAPAGPLHESKEIRARIQQAIDVLNARQASYSTIKKFAILQNDFTIESGELTPTLKVKRKLCTQKYKAVLDAFYVD